MANNLNSNISLKDILPLIFAFGHLVAARFNIYYDDAASLILILDSVDLIAVVKMLSFF
jgi:hypothetical protein